MKLPNWFKIIWWIFLILALFLFLFPRYSSFSVGNATFIDLVVLIILIALLLLPLFEEFSLLGFKFKKEINVLKNEVKREIDSLKNEIHNSINVSPQFIYPPPLPDSQLPDLEVRIKNAMESALENQSKNKVDYKNIQIVAPDDTNYLFSVRYHLEKQLRRIWTNRFANEDSKRPIPVFQIIQTLAKLQLIPGNLVNPIKEVYSVCSPAIHGEEVSEAQLKFVKDVAPMLINKLVEIK